MKNLPHPGLSVRHDCIEALGLTTTAAAKILGITRQTLNNLINGKSGISADMALRLDKAFGGGAETWLRLQMAYDLAQARKREKDIHVRRNPPHRSRAPMTRVVSPAPQFTGRPHGSRSHGRARRPQLRQSYRR